MSQEAADEKERPSQSDTTTTRSTTVLLVDDTIAHLDMYELALSERYQVVRASRGRTAYSLAVNERPDAIISDVVMPDLDGWSLCDMLKSNPVTATIPVILLTAFEQNDLDARAAAVGAATVLLKPCSVERLSETIDSAIKQAR
jgi:putative two-component system response regulator